MATTSGKRRPRGDGSLQRLARDKFKIQVTVGYDENGRQRRKSFTAKTQREALAMLDRFKAERQTAGLVPDSTTTLEQFTTRWLGIKKFSAKAKTCATYELACAKHILPALGRCRLAKLTTAHINDYIRAKARQGLSAATLGQHRAILHNILALAVAEGSLGRNVVAGAGPVPRQPKEQSILTDGEITRLLTAARAYAAENKRGFRQIYHIILLALATGLRRGEIVGLRWENIDIAKAELKVSENVVRDRRQTSPRHPEDKRVAADHRGGTGGPGDSQERPVDPGRRPGLHRRQPAPGSFFDPGPHLPSPAAEGRHHQEGAAPLTCGTPMSPTCWPTAMTSRWSQPGSATTCAPRCRYTPTPCRKRTGTRRPSSPPNSFRRRQIVKCPATL